jgi:uncharacterized protein (TIGR02145 family)
MTSVNKYNIIISIIAVILNSCEFMVEPGSQYRLTLLGENGSISTTPKREMYEEGETVTIEAIPDNGFTFLNWGEDATGSRISLRLEMNGDKHITAFFVSSGTFTVTDIDSNQYHIVRIGNQVWTTSSYRVTRFNDGTEIRSGSDSAVWAVGDSCPNPMLCKSNSMKARLCYYDNTTNPDTISKYGALYNQFAVLSGKLAPQGWHVSTSEDWDSLELFLANNGFSWDGINDLLSIYRIGKSLAAQTDWIGFESTGTVGDDLSLNNRSGFTALPGGWRSSAGIYLQKGEAAYFWSNRDCREIHFNSSRVTTNISINKYSSSGYSVRLVKD